MSAGNLNHHFEVPTGAPGRLDQILCAFLPGHSRSQLQEWVRNGCVLVDGQPPAKPGVKLRGGERIQVSEPVRQPIDAKPEELPLEILHEDPDVLVINKAAGMVVHPAVGNWSGTVVNALLHHCEDLSGQGGEERPGIVHRLDKETSGCLVVAKNDHAHRALSEQFAGREVLKIYIALAIGRFRERKGIIEAPIGRHPVHRQKMAVISADRGRNARTDWTLLEEIKACGTDVGVVQCRLHTGRTHQIRVHMAHIGHGLLGDAVYGRKAGAPRHMLHAWRLGFHHPRSKEWMEFTSPLPDDFKMLGVSVAAPSA